VKAGPFTLTVSQVTSGMEVGPCTVALPQDGLRVLRPASNGGLGSDTHRGRVRDSYFLGRLQQLVVDVGNTTVRAVQSSGEPLPINAIVDVAVLDETVRVFRGDVP